MLSLATSLTTGPSGGTGSPDGREFSIGEDASEAFQALSSETARTILAELYRQPRTASELADDIDMSLQNINHHLNQLESSGLVTMTGTELSDTNYEMERYEPAHDRIALAAGEKPTSNEPDETPEAGNGSSRKPASVREIQIAVAFGVILGFVLAAVVRRLR